MSFQKSRHYVRILMVWAFCSAALPAPWSAVQAQEPQKDAELETGWSNNTDLGLSATQGNSETDTLTVHNLLQWRSERASFRLKLEGLRSDTTDDRFRKADPGFSWEPGAPAPQEVTSMLFDPEKERDVEKYFAEARYERSLGAESRRRRGDMSWHAGASWDRNLDAGVLGRTVVFAGFGNTWWNREDLKFRNLYSLSWTDRNEELSDPEKDEQFFGLRYNWLYENRWGKHVTYHNDWTFNVQLDDLSDYSSTMTNFGRSYVLTFQERHADVFDPVRARLRAGGGTLRRSGADYLAYALFDLIIDAFFPVTEVLGDELEVLEDLVMTQPGSETLSRLNRVKGSLLALRRAISPQRETVNRLLRDQTPLIGDGVRVYLRDLYDHCIQTSEAVESAREMASGLMNTYLSVVGHRTNEVMKVLTIVASIFVPLTFMAGIYGMNFEHMPELAHPWGYPALLVAMLVLGFGMILYFRRKGWIGPDGEPGR